MKRFVSILAALLTLVVGSAAPSAAITPAQVVALTGARSPCADGALRTDFARGLYCLKGVRYPSFIAMPGASFSRTGQELAQRADGSWQAFASGVPAITDAGLSVWEARTNKSTNYNAAPQALMTPVSATAFNAAGGKPVNMTAGGDAAALFGVVADPSGLRNAGYGALIDEGVMNGRVYVIDNSAGASQAYMLALGQTGNTNSHNWSAVIRGGAGAIGQDDAISAPNSGTRRVLFSASTPYRRVETGTTVFSDQNNRNFFIRADAGQVVYFILNQAEEGTFVTPHIVVAGASATRAAPFAFVDLSLPIVAPFTFGGEGRGMASVGSTQRFLSTLSNGTGSTGRYVLLRSSSNNATLATGNSPSTLLFRAGYASAASMKLAAYVDAAGLANFAADGVLSGTTAAAAQPAGGFNRMTLGAHQSTGTLSLNGYLRNAVLQPSAVSDAQLQALTSAGSAANDNWPSTLRLYGFANERAA